MVSRKIKMNVDHFYSAVRHGHWEIAKEWLRQARTENDNENLITNACDTLLCDKKMYTEESPPTTFVQMVVQAHPDSILEVDQWGRNAIHHAMINSASVATIRLLICESNNELVHWPDCDGCLALHYSVNEYFKTREPLTPIDIYLRWGDDDRDHDSEFNVVNKQINLREDIFRAVFEAFPEAAYAATTEGIIPLMLACTFDCPWAVETLLNAYPAGAKRFDKEGNTALHHACSAGLALVFRRPSAFGKLVAANPHAVRAKSKTGALPLHTLCWYRDDVDVMCLTRQIEALLQLYPEAAHVRDGAGILVRDGAGMLRDGTGTLPINALRDESDESITTGFGELLVLAKAYPESLMPEDYRDRIVHYNGYHSRDYPLNRLFFTRKVTPKPWWPWHRSHRMGPENLSVPKQLVNVHPPALLRVGPQGAPLPLLAYILRSFIHDEDGKDQDSRENGFSDSLNDDNGDSYGRYHDEFSSNHDRWCKYRDSRTQDNNLATALFNGDSFTHFMLVKTYLALLSSLGENISPEQQQNSTSFPPVIIMIASLGRLVHPYDFHMILQELSENIFIFQQRDPYDGNFALHKLCAAKSALTEEDRSYILRDYNPPEDEAFEARFGGHPTSLIGILLRHCAKSLLTEHDAPAVARNYQGELPVHVYLKNHNRWSRRERENDIPLLLGVTLGVAHIEDPTTKLYPFMLSAIGTVGLDYHDVEETLFLLKQFVANGDLSRFASHDRRL
jgi:ankyrin repeat protein